MMVLGFSVDILVEIIISISRDSMDTSQVLSEVVCSRPELLFCLAVLDVTLEAIADCVKRWMKTSFMSVKVVGGTETFCTTAARFATVIWLDMALTMFVEFRLRLDPSVTVLAYNIVLVSSRD